ncbi:hypothetical protein E2C01_094302 [Portunus trituberculatus]|uniref:Uncharacterized protein n=1 Tax=Portunus trituberculatus TaxID=210409 RepID=A0A5B7JWI1_PORTR|nr:hypothetical protein [Portunus trituberculatus]
MGVVTGRRSVQAQSKPRGQTGRRGALHDRVDEDVVTWSSEWFLVDRNVPVAKSVSLLHVTSIPLWRSTFGSLRSHSACNAVGVLTLIYVTRCLGLASEDAKWDCLQDTEGEGVTGDEPRASRRCPQVTLLWQGLAGTRVSVSFFRYKLFISIEYLVRHLSS